MNTLLLSIMSLVMTWTVETKSTISSSGDVPAQVAAEYACSYQKGSVRNGDSATLTLASMGGLTIERVEMYMRSNKSAGAGVISVYADGACIAQKEGSLRDWIGKYDNSAFYPIEVYVGAKQIQDSLVINLTGTTNSLYIEKYVITYQQAPTHTLMLMEGSEVHATLTESIGGEGISLPSMSNKEEWQFVGWTDVPFWNVSSLPENIYPPQTKIGLTEDLTLWAVWRYMPHSEDMYMVNMQSGNYIYANSDNQLAIAGVVANGQMEQALVNLLDSNQIYHITFDPAAQTATIQHVLTGQYIGYSAITLVPEPTPWKVWHEGKYTAFYTVYNGRTYVLWQNVLGDEPDCRKAGLFMTYDISTTPTVLICPQLPEEQIYTCHPEHDMHLEQTQICSDEIVIPFGIYEIHVHKGEKSIRLRQ